PGLNAFNGSPCGGAGQRTTKMCSGGACVTPPTPVTHSVTVPHQNDVLTLGQATPITWSATSFGSQVKIYKQQGTTAAVLITTVATSSGTYSWTASGTAATNWFIRVEDASAPERFAYSGQFELSVTGAVNGCATNNNGCDSHVVCTFSGGQSVC